MEGRTECGTLRLVQTGFAVVLNKASTFSFKCFSSNFTYFHYFGQKFFAVSRFPMSCQLFLIDFPQKVNRTLKRRFSFKMFLPNHSLNQAGHIRHLESSLHSFGSSKPEGFGGPTPHTHGACSATVAIRATSADKPSCSADRTQPRSPTTKVEGIAVMSRCRKCTCNGELKINCEKKWNASTSFRFAWINSVHVVNSVALKRKIWSYCVFVFKALRSFSKAFWDLQGSF